jgi:hypothetical protein
VTVKSTVIWEEPPPATHRTTLAGEAAELRANPGQWARVATFKSRTTARSVATGIKNNRLAAFRTGCFKVAVRTVNGSRQVHLYARFIPAVRTSRPAASRRTAPRR